MTLKLNRVREVVKVHVRAKFHQAKCSGSRLILGTETKKTRDENITVRRCRADSSLIKESIWLICSKCELLQQNTIQLVCRSVSPRTFCLYCDGLYILPAVKMTDTWHFPDSSLLHNHLTSRVSSSPLLSSITPSFFHSKLKTFLFLKSYPP